MGDLIDGRSYWWKSTLVENSLGGKLPFLKNFSHIYWQQNLRKNLFDQKVVNERERKRGNHCNLGAVIFYGRTFYYCGWPNLGKVMTMQNIDPPQSVPNLMYGS